MSAAPNPADMMIGVIEIDLFHLQVAVFGHDAHRVAFLREEGVEAASVGDDAAYASAHMDSSPGGKAWFSMVIKDAATRATWAHECVHIADFIMDRLGMPCTCENTEIRAYLVGFLFSRLEQIMEG